MTLGREETERLLRPHAQAFVDMHRMAITEMKACGLFPFQKKSTQASVLNDLIGRKLVRMGMADDASSAGLQVSWRNGSPRMIISGAFFARFKKAGGRNRVGRNIMTKAEEQFVNPMFPDAEFPMLEKIEFVYTLDMQTQDLMRLEVLRRDGEGAAWRFDLLDVIEPTLPFPISLPQAGDAPADRRARVVLKKGNAKDRDAKSK